MVATVFSNGYKSAKAALPHQQVAQTHRQQIKEMLPNRVVGYSPDLARAVGGATTGLFLSQLLFLSDKGHNPEGWVYKSEQEMGKETGLTKREQQTARRKLLSLGVITIMHAGRLEKHLPLQGDLGEALSGDRWFSAATNRTHSAG